MEDVKAEYEKKKKSGEEISADFAAKLKELEAELNLHWKKRPRFFTNQRLTGHATLGYAFQQIPMNATRT